MRGTQWGPGDMQQWGPAGATAIPMLKPGVCAAHNERSVQQHEATALPVVPVTPRYTSPTCLACGHVARTNRPLAVPHLTCAAPTAQPRTAATVDEFHRMAEAGVFGEDDRL